MIFNDNDIIDVWFGYGYEIDENQEYLGKDTYYHGASRIIHSYLESIGIKYPNYIRVVGTEYGAFIDFGSHSQFFKLRKVKGNENE